MERDRRLSLLRQAHVEGYLDCREARPLDRNWQLKMVWTLNWVERKNRNEVRRMQHDMNCALLDYFTGDTAVDLHWEQAQDMQAAVHKVLIPWEKLNRGKFGRRQFRDMVGLWQAVYGDQQDPKVQAKINYTAEALIKAASESRGGYRGRSI